MTNEIILSPGVELFGTNAVTVVTDGWGSISIAAVSWMLGLVLLPLASMVVFIHGLVVYKRGSEASWQRRFLLLAGLTVIATTLFAMGTTLQHVFYESAINEWDGGASAMLRLNIAHALTIFRWGTLSGCFCFALALLLPGKRTKTETPTTARTVPLPRGGSTSG